jgi:gas vesicle protein
MVMEREASMNNSGRAALFFVSGLGLGIGLALLFAPKSGEETREWAKDMAEEGVKRLKRQGRQSIDHLHEVVDSGEKKVASAFKTSREVLDSVAAKLG